VIFKVKVQGGVAYRCWIRMGVGSADGRIVGEQALRADSRTRSTARQDVFRPNTASYLTAQGPPRQVWKWVACEAGSDPTESLIYFRASREVTVRVQAGMEGVGFDQFVLSRPKFLETPPAEAIVKK